MKLFIILTVFLNLHISQYVVRSQFESLSNVTTADENILDVINVNEGSALLDIVNSELLQQVVNNGNFSVADLDAMNQWMSWFYRLQNVQINLKNEECSKQLQLYIDGLMNMEDWAMRMFDATAKPQTGILEGNTMHVGNYDECLKINVFVNGTNIDGQYCTGVLTDTEENTVDPYDTENIAILKLSYGFCVPAVCDNASLADIARVLESSFDSPYHLHFPEELCDSLVKPKPFTTWAIFCISFLGVIALIITFSTLYDILRFRMMKGANETSLYTAFSFYTNGKKLFTTKKSSDSLSCLNGMRVISMIWIIVAHRYLYTFTLPLTNLLTALKWEQNYESTLITAAGLAVDTFFMISGLLIVYVFLNHKEKGHHFSVIMFYVHRVLRLTPALAVVVLFYATMLKYIGSGPFWPVVYLYYQSSCETHWWSTLLYVQNYVHSLDSCVNHSWYLAVDTQLYILSPLLLFPLVRWPKRTIVAVMLLVVLCSVIVFATTWVNELGPAFYGVGPDGLEQLYNPTHARAAPWLIGIIMGYVMYQCKYKVVILNQVTVVLLWLVSTSIMLAIILYHKEIGSTVEVSNLKASLFNSLARTSWTIAVSIIAFLCVTGYGGFINKFLSSSVFTVLIRINYSMYLLHMLVILYDVAQKRTPDYASPYNLFYIFWGDLSITLILSILWTLAFESPVIVLEKILFGNKKKTLSTRLNSKLHNGNNNLNGVIIHNK